MKIRMVLSHVGKLEKKWSKMTSCYLVLKKNARQSIIYILMFFRGRNENVIGVEETWA